SQASSYYQQRCFSRLQIKIFQRFILTYSMAVHNLATHRVSGYHYLFYWEKLFHSICSGKYFHHTLCQHFIGFASKGIRLMNESGNTLSLSIRQQRKSRVSPYSYYSVRTKILDNPSYL